MKRYLGLLIWIIFLPVTSSGQLSVDSSYNYTQLTDHLAEARSENNYAELAKTYYLLGLYEEQNFSKSDKSFEYFTNAKQYFEVINDTLMSKEVDLAIADRYESIGFYQEASDLYESLLRFYGQRQDSLKMAHIYFEMSQIAEYKGDNELRLDYLEKSIQHSNGLYVPQLMVDILEEKIESYIMLNEMDSALISAKQIYDQSRELNFRQGQSIGLYQVGYVNKLTSNYPTAIRFLRQSERLSEKKPYSEHRMRIYDLLAETYNNINDYQNAYEYAEKFANLNDSILQKKMIQSTNNLALKYQTNEISSNMKLLEIENKYAENRNNQQRRLVYILGIGVMLLIALVYFIIDFYRDKMRSEGIISKQNEEISDQRIRELEDRIKLRSMHSMLEGQEMERERVAKDLHDSLGGLLSAIKLQFDMVKSKSDDISEIKEYHSANQMLDTAVDEVRSISQNLQPGSLMKLGLVAALKDLFNRFTGPTYPEIDFQYYNVPENIDTMKALSIYRIIQELLYNAIKHAQASEILVQINREEDELIVQFEDDGIGYDPERLPHRGMGLENIESRIVYLKGNISVDTAPGSGTSIILHVKYK